MTYLYCCWSLVVSFSSQYCTLSVLLRVRGLNQVLDLVNRTQIIYLRDYLINVFNNYNYEENLFLPVYILRLRLAKRLLVLFDLSNSLVLLSDHLLDLSDLCSKQLPLFDKDCYPWENWESSWTYQNLSK